MTTRIGLISDVHATSGPLQEALRIFEQEQVEVVLCAGDIAGYGTELETTVALMSQNGCRAIVGNHDLWHLRGQEEENRFSGPVEGYLRSLYGTLELTLEGIKLGMVHASPPDSLLNGIRLLDEHGGLIGGQVISWQDRLSTFPCDILVVGHTHQVFAEKLGDVLVINPGSTLFNHTCAILTLPDMTVQFRALSGQEPLLSWHWEMIKTVGLGRRAPKK